MNTNYYLSKVVPSNFNLYPQMPVPGGTCTPNKNICGHAVSGNSSYYRIFPAIRRGFRPSRMTSNNLISPMKFCHNATSTLPKQCQSSRSVLQDGSRTFGLFWKEKTPSYNRRNTVLECQIRWSADDNSEIFIFQLKHILQVLIRIILTIQF